MSSISIESDLFEEFWLEYPRKEAKIVARKSFNKAIQKVTLQSMLDAIRKQSKSEQWAKGFIPHAATWLNQERWTDELQPPTIQTKSAIAPWQAQIMHGEYLRVIDRMKVIKSQYEAHQHWEENDKDEYRKLKARMIEIRQVLGIVI